MQAATEQAITLVGQAGRCGKDVRSDCRATVEPKEQGGIVIELSSRVDSYYGESIREQVVEVMTALGVMNARVVLEDEGALPFAIGARLEAAVRATGLRVAKWRPSAAQSPEHSTKDRLRRSRLYLPGSEPKYFINAALHGPDAIILDLEDSVHPDEKDAARIMVRNALVAVDFGFAERMVRINQLPLGMSDLEEVLPANPDVILIPKVETAEQVKAVDEFITTRQQSIPSSRPIGLMPIIESALGVENALQIASASDRVVALTIGLEDYTASIGVPKTPTGEESLYARMRIVNAAKAAGIQAIDSVYGDVGDMDGLALWAQKSRALGFEGMGCIHPSQIAVIHSAYAPSKSEIEKALKIVEVYEDAVQQGRGVVSLGSKMIDPPVVQRALKLVEQARKIGLAPGKETQR